MPSKEPRHRFVETLQKDHAAILRGLNRLRARLESPQGGRDPEAPGIVEEIIAEMELHFKKEEELVFPEIHRFFDRALKKMGGDIRPVGGPANVMRLEHRSLRKILQNLKEMIESNKIDEATQTLGHLSSLIESHIFREENVLYVVVEAKLERSKKEEMARRMAQLTGDGPS